jgi:hypothetical protein
LNGYNRSTTEGNRTAVNLCIYTQQQRIAVVEGKVRKGAKDDTVPAE